MTKQELRAKAMEEVRATQGPMAVFRMWESGLLKDGEAYLRATLDLIESTEVSILQRQSREDESDEHELGISA